MMFGAILFGFILGIICTILGIYSWIQFQKYLQQEDVEDTVYATSAKGNVEQPLSTYDIVSDTTVNQQHNGSFITQLIHQLWQYINTASCQIIKEIVEAQFVKILPGPLATLHFTQFDLGTVPLRIDNIIVHDIDKSSSPNSNSDTLQIDMDIIWDGECTIQLKANNIGTFGVRHIKFAGRLTILLRPLQSTIPIISTIQIAFVNPPLVQLTFTGLAKLAGISLIKNGIQKAIDKTLSDLVVLPNRLIQRIMDPTLNWNNSMDETKAISFFDIYKPPLGVVRITLVRGYGFQIEKRLLRKNDIPDVYCKLRLGNAIYQSSIVKNSTQPIWDEAFDFLFYDYNQAVYIQAYDKDEGTLDVDDDLGTTQITVGELLLKSNRSTDLELANIHNNHKGTKAFLQISADFCPITNTTTPSTNNDGRDDVSNTLRGFISILLSRVYNLPNTYDKKNISYFVKVVYGNHSGDEYTTLPILKKPVPGMNGLSCQLFDVSFVIPIMEPLDLTDIQFFLYSKNLKEAVNLVGSFTLSYQDLLKADNLTLTSNTPFGDHGGILEYQVSFDIVQRPTNIVQSQHQKSATSGRNDSITTSNLSVKVTILSGRGFTPRQRRSLPPPFRKKSRTDIPDCYVKVRCGLNPHIWRTSTIKDCTEPQWHESYQYNYVQHNSVVTLDVYDENSGARDTDTYIGSIRVTIGKLLLLSSSSNGPVEFELHDKYGNGCASFISIQGEHIEPNHPIDREPESSVGVEISTNYPEDATTSTNYFDYTMIDEDIPV